MGLKEVPRQGKKQYYHPCKCCNKTFYSRNKKAVYCSKECCNTQKKKPRISKCCLVCGSIINVRGTYHLEKAKYCDKECAAKGKSLRPIKEFDSTCEHCGKRFIYKARNNMKRRFCGKECAGSGKSSIVNKKRKELETKREFTETERIKKFLENGKKVNVLQGNSLFADKIQEYLDKGKTINRLPFINGIVGDFMEFMKVSVSYEELPFRRSP